MGEANVGIPENHRCRAALTNGVVYSIYDEELKRGLLDGPAFDLAPFGYTR
jgi:hypothetical protein